jgi:ribosome recycling factor
MTVKEAIHKLEEDMKKTIDACLREFNTVRTGRASPGLVEGIHVDYYGTPTVLKQLASISIPDARLIVIQPWDPSSMPDIEKAIFSSNLGISPVNDGKVIRLSIPALSEERRDELTKVIKKKSEDIKVSLRTIRRDANDAIKKMQDDKVISEDERFKTQEQIQKITDKYIAKIEELLVEKEKEIKEF